MKKYIEYFSVILACLLPGACDNYLSIVPKGEIYLETVEEYSQLLNAEVSFRLSYPTSDIQGITDNDWYNPVMAYNGVKTPALLASHIMFMDPTVPGYERIEKQWHTTSATSGSAFYGTCFGRIQKVCNIILDKIDDASGNAALREKTKAEARALRAYNYFMLVNVYAKHYSQEVLNDLTVPLITRFDLDEVFPQGTVATVYQLIEDDLKAAIPVLEKGEAANSYHFSAAAAYALQAKVYLFKKDFANAKIAAQKSYDLFSKKQNFIFDMVKFYDDGMGYNVNSHIPENLYFATINVNANGDPQTSGGISPELVSLFEEYNDQGCVDVRYEGFFTFETTATGNPNAVDYRQGDAKSAPAWDATRKLGAENFRYNFTGIRTTDVVLMLAELAAREGKFQEAADYVDMVRVKRIKGYHKGDGGVPSDKNSAMEMVMKERRKEFLYGFNRWWDLRRLNTEPEYRQDISRTIPANPIFYDRFAEISEFGNVPYKTFTLPWDSWLWVKPLPYQEMYSYTTLKYNVPM